MARRGGATREAAVSLCTPMRDSRAKGKDEGEEGRRVRVEQCPVSLVDDQAVHVGHVVPAAELHPHLQHRDAPAVLPALLCASKEETRKYANALCADSHVDSHANP